jgi:Lon protease-like protein
VAILDWMKSLRAPSTETIPLFPLNTVLFPRGVLPLRVFEQRYMDMAKACLRDESMFGVCLIREGQEVGGKVAVPETVGCTARIVDWNMEQLGVLQIRAEGQYRFRIRSTRDNGHGLLIGEVEAIDAEPATPVSEDLAACGDVLRAVIGNAGDAAFSQPLQFDDAVWLGYRLSELLPIKLAVKQKLLELTDPTARLQVLRDFMRNQGLIA